MSGSATLLQNGFLCVRICGAELRDLRVDPSGRSAYKPTGFRRVGISGSNPSAPRSIEIHSETDATLFGVKGILTRERFSGTDFKIHETIPIYQWPDTAWKIAEGRALGQSFEAHAPFERAGVYLYAAGEPESTACRVSLKKEGPHGQTLASVVVRGAEAYGFPTIWTFLESKGWEAGRYFLEVGDVRGDIRCWSSITDVYPNGCAYVGDRPVEDRDLIFLYARRETQSIQYDLRIQLDGPDLVQSLTVIGQEAAWGEEAQTGFDVQVPWVRDGYDVSDHTKVLFKRFVTDSTQYVPIEQFKRFPVAWPNYQSPTDRAAFPRARWIHAVGAGDCDYRFSDFDSTGSWPLHPNSMTLRFLGERLRIGIRPTSEEPAIRVPTFYTSVPDFDVTHNAFFLERSYGLSSGRAGGEWLEWIGPQSCWVGNPRLDQFKKGLVEQRIGEDGYVWSMGYEGGYPHGLRYGMGPRARRHYGSNGAFILGAFYYFAWTRERLFLQDQAPRLRSAMDFMFDSQDMRWRDDLFTIVEPHHDGTSRGMASTGWDCLPFGYKCAVTNAQAYEALNGMAEIEEELGDRNRAKELLAARQRLKSSFNRHFWDSDTGRYIGCVDANGEKHDYGFTFVNLFAMAAGLAELWQVERIYDWMENQPTATGEKDAYKFVVAPRANTLDIQDWWYLEGNKEWPGDIPFGLAFQNGGAFLFTSYYDILARLKYFGPDNAFRRYEEILARYREPDRLCGGNPLYHGEIDGYQVACSVVFPEAGLAPCSFLYGFLGVSASRTGLRIKPCLPSDLRTAGVRNIVYAGITLDLRIERIPRGYRFEVSTSDAKSNGGISLNGQRALGRMIYEGEEVLLGFPEAMLA